MKPYIYTTTIIYALAGIIGVIWFIAAHENFIVTLLNLAFAVWGIVVWTRLKYWRWTDTRNMRTK